MEKNGDGKLSSIWVLGIMVSIVFSLIGWTTNKTLDSIDKNITAVSGTVQELKETVDESLKVQNGHATQIRLLEREIDRLKEELIKAEK